MKSAFYALNPLQADGRGQVAVCAGQPGKCFAFRIAVEMKNLPQSMNACIRASGTGNLYGMGGDLAECVFTSRRSSVLLRKQLGSSALGSRAQPRIHNRQLSSQHRRPRHRPHSRRRSQ